MAKYDALYFESQRKTPMLISDTTLDKQLRRTILQNIENYDIGTLKRIAYEVRCEEMGLLPDSTYIEYGITESEYWWSSYHMIFPMNHQQDTDTKSFAIKLMLLQFGLYLLVGGSTIMAMNLVLSGDSTTQRNGSIMPLSTPPSKVIR